VTTTTLQPFYGSLDFVQDKPGETVPVFLVWTNWHITKKQLVFVFVNQCSGNSYNLLKNAKLSTAAYIHKAQ